MDRLCLGIWAPCGWVQLAGDVEREPRFAVNEEPLLQLRLSKKGQDGRHVGGLGGQHGAHVCLEEGEKELQKMRKHNDADR